MGHLIRWDNDDKTVVLQQYTEEGTKDDLYDLARTSSHMLQEHTHTIHLIIDERQANFVLNSADMSYMEKTTPKNQGAVIVVVSSENISYKNVVQKLGQRVGPNAFREAYFVQTIQEARQFLKSQFGVHYPILSEE